MIKVQQKLQMAFVFDSFLRSFRHSPHSCETCTTLIKTVGRWIFFRPPSFLSIHLCAWPSSCISIFLFNSLNNTHTRISGRAFDFRRFFFRSCFSRCSGIVPFRLLPTAMPSVNRKKINDFRTTTRCKRIMALVYTQLYIQIDAIVGIYVLYERRKKSETAAIDMYSPFHTLGPTKSIT